MLKAYATPMEVPHAVMLTGPAELYRVLLTVKNGFTDSDASRASYVLTKAQAKAAGIKWTFVVSSCEVLGLKLSNNHGRYGHLISR